MFTVHAVDSDCCIFWDLDSNLIHFVEDNLLTIAPNNQAGDKLHARKVCQASFSASLKITFAPYGRAFSPGRKMGTQMFHGEKLKLNWRTMFSDFFEGACRITGMCLSCFCWSWFCWGRCQSGKCALFLQLSAQI